MLNYLSILSIVTINTIVFTFLPERLSERCAPAVGALVGAPFRIVARSATRSAAPEFQLGAHPERRSEIFRSANALHGRLNLINLTLINLINFTKDTFYCKWAIVEKDRDLLDW